MAIYYKVVERANPLKPNEPKKFYATAAERKRVDLKEIAQTISDKSTTVSHVDVYAVLMALGDEIRTRTLAGENIHLGDLGYFHTTLTSKGMAKAEEVTASTIDSANLRFVAGKDLAASLAGAEFKKAAAEASKPAEPGKAA